MFSLGQSLKCNQKLITYLLKIIKYNSHNNYKNHKSEFSRNYSLQIIWLEIYKKIYIKSKILNVKGQDLI